MGAGSRTVPVDDDQPRQPFGSRRALGAVTTESGTLLHLNKKQNDGARARPMAHLKAPGLFRLEETLAH